MHSFIRCRKQFRRTKNRGLNVMENRKKFCPWYILHLRAGHVIESLEKIKCEEKEVLMKVYSQL